MTSCSMKLRSTIGKATEVGALKDREVPSLACYRPVSLSLTEMGAKATIDLKELINVSDVILIIMGDEKCPRLRI